MDIHVYTLKMAVLPYLNDLKNFEFYYLNPLFWMFFLLLFLILLRSWKAKKALSFSLSLAAILLINTKIEHFVSGLRRTTEGFDANIIVRMISGMVIVFICIYYFLVRED